MLLRMTAEKLGSELLIAASEHAAVIEMEISELRERRGLMSARELKAHVAAHPPATDMDVDAVANLLEASGLGAHVPRFKAARVDGRALLSLSNERLRVLLDTGEADPFEHTPAAAELLESIISHLRWRLSHAARGGKEEL